MSDLAQTRSEETDATDTLQVEYDALQKEVESKKKEFAAARVGRLFKLTMVRKHLKKEMHVVAEKMDSDKFGKRTFRLSPAAVDVLHEYLETSIHLYLEASTHVMTVNSARQLGPKHLQVIDRLCAFKFPFLERNKYQTDSVYARNPLMHQMLHLYENDLNTIYDLDGAYDPYHPKKVDDRDLKTKRKRCFVQKHQQKEKDTRDALQLASSNLQKFETQHGNVLRTLDDGKMEGMASAANLDAFVQMDLDSVRDDREDDDVSMTSLNSSKSYKCDMTETAADYHGVIFM